jgi:hypothetical protein
VFTPSEDGIRKGLLKKIDTLQTGITRSGAIMRPEQNSISPSNPTMPAITKPIAIAVNRITIS